MGNIVNATPASSLLPSQLPVLRIEIAIPAGVDASQVDPQIARILVALSDLHRARGSSGLKIVGGQCREGVPVQGI